MNAILEALTQYYGLDWMVMVIGLFGTYLITRHKRIGFLLSSVACVLGVVVAGMSGQMGYVIYNAIILMMFSRAFINWPSKAVTA